MVEIKAWLVEKETGGFTTGISRKGTFTEDEFTNKEYLKLLPKNTDKDLVWSFSFKRIKD